MRKLFLELRRREVFRSAGLYVGVCWIVIEVASVLLPAFDAPEWTIRAVIIVALIGFPVTVVLAWFFDLTDSGIKVEDEQTGKIVTPVGGRKMDFVVIGVLAIALGFSLYMNFTSNPSEATPLAPISVLIADFDNQTGNALFDGTLEQALSLGIEGASYITAYPRNTALQQAQSLNLGDRLDEETARLVAVRQDVRMVLSGAIKSVDDELELELKAVDPTSGELIAATDTNAAEPAEVLFAINELAADFRKELGEDSLNLDQLAAGETVTAASLEAMKFYTQAQDLARSGRDEDAIAYYAKAIEEDPEMARAYSGWGLSAHKIGRPGEANEKWQTALSLLDRMTERERYRTLGLYYTVVSVDYDQAISNYEQLVGKFPADGAGNNNLAILYTFTAQYERALAQSEQLLKIYPGRVLYHANHAQYAVYAGDMATARAEATQVIADDPSFFKSYMILAITALQEGDIAAAKSHYGRMAETGTRGASLANIGLADIAIFESRFDDAVELLRIGISLDEQEQNARGRATKQIALAQAHLGLGVASTGLGVLDQIESERGEGVLIPTAEIYAANSQFDKAFAIAEQYRQKLGPARAYAKLIDGINALHQQEYIIAIETLREALNYADLWIIRFYLGQAYVGAGHSAAAMAEFELCIERRSEAAGMFFDDVPTWRYTASLSEWKRKAADSLTANRAASVSQ